MPTRNFPAVKPLGEGWRSGTVAGIDQDPGAVGALEVAAVAVIIIAAPASFAFGGDSSSGAGADRFCLVLIRVPVVQKFGRMSMT